MVGLESMLDFILDDYIKKSDEELVASMSILSQINLIKNRLYLPDDYSITGYYYDLRRRTLVWLTACNKNINDDNQQYAFPIEKKLYTLLPQTTYTNNASSVVQKNISKS